MKKFPIGFTALEESDEHNEVINENTASCETPPRKSVARIYFPERGMTLSYYNDLFDLHKGDIVYVDGKLEGLRGRVVDVTYTFKIKLSDYKRVIAVVDTNVNGEFFFAGSHILSFDRGTIPFGKVNTWFNAPTADEEYAVGDGDESFPLDDLSKLDISHDVAERGNAYFMENKVCYISVDGTQGKAIVNGSENYVVEFTYRDGEISTLVCSCFCSHTCKHEFAVILQLRECLEIIENEYADKYNGYFAAIAKGTFMSKVFDKQTGGFNVL